MRKVLNVSHNSVKMFACAFLYRQQLMKIKYGKKRKDKHFTLSYDTSGVSEQVYVEGFTRTLSVLRSKSALNLNRFHDGEKCMRRI